MTDLSCITNSHVKTWNAPKSELPVVLAPASQAHWSRSPECTRLRTKLLPTTSGVREVPTRCQVLQSGLVRGLGYQLARLEARLLARGCGRKVDSNSFGSILISRLPIVANRTNHPLVSTLSPVIYPRVVSTMLCMLLNTISYFPFVQK